MKSADGAHVPVCDDASNVISGTKSTVTFTNTRWTGKLQLVKEVVSPFTSEQNAKYKITVALTKDDEPVTGKFHYKDGKAGEEKEVTFDSDGKQTFEVGTEDYVEITDVPIEVVCTVTETVDFDGKTFDKNIFVVQQTASESEEAGSGQNENGLSQIESGSGQNEGSSSQNEGSPAQIEGGSSQNEGSSAQNEGDSSQNESGSAQNENDSTQNTTDLDPENGGAEETGAASQPTPDEATTQPMTTGTTHVVKVVNSRKVQPLSMMKVNSVDLNHVPGAQFVLKDGNDAELYTLHSNDAGMLVQDEDETVDKFDLPLGTYKLYETHAPDGYNSWLEGEYAEITVTANGVYYTIPSSTLSYRGGVTTMDWTTTGGESTSDEPTNKVIQIMITNSPGVVLPATGGEGTLPYTVLGSALMLLAIALLLKKNRQY